MADTKGWKKKGWLDALHGLVASIGIGGKWKNRPLQLSTTGPWIRLECLYWRTARKPEIAYLIWPLEIPVVPDTKELE